MVYSPSIRGNNDVGGILFVEKCIKVYKNQLHLYQTDESRLQMVMNAAACMVTRCDNYEHTTPGAPRCSTLAAGALSLIHI